MRTLLLLLAALPAAAGEPPAPPAKACPEQPARALYETARAAGALPAPLSDAALEARLAELRSSSAPAVLPLDADGLSREIVKALNIGFLLEALDAAPPLVSLGRAARRDGYSERTVRFKDAAVGDFTALLLEPTDGAGPRPAVLGLHGHGSSPREFASRYMGAELARRGYVVLLPDFSLDARCDREISVALLRKGLTLLGARTYQALAALKYLRALDSVRAGRVAVIGHSNGSAVAALVVRLRDWPALQVRDFEADYRDLSFGEAPGGAHCETIPALFPFSATINDRATSAIPLLAVPYDFSRRAVRDRIAAFLDDGLRRGAPQSQRRAEAFRLADYFLDAGAALSASRPKAATDSLAAAVEIWKTARLDWGADALPKGRRDRFEWLVAYALQSLASRPPAERLGLVRAWSALSPQEPALKTAAEGLEASAKADGADGAARLAALIERLADDGGAGSRAPIGDPGTGALLRQAERSLAAGEMARALELLQTLSASNPDDPAVWLAMAQAAQGAADKAQAARALARARALVADDAGRRRLALLYQESGDRQAALELLEALSARAPQDASLRADAGVCLFQLGRGEEAAGRFEDALKLDPRLWQAYLSLGALRAAAGQKAAAVTLYDRALELNPSEPEKTALLEARREAAGAAK